VLSSTSTTATSSEAVPETLRVGEVTTLPASGDVMATSGGSSSSPCAGRNAGDVTPAIEAASASSVVME
jgi:hypothetical protein